MPITTPQRTPTVASRMRGCAITRLLILCATGQGLAQTRIAIMPFQGVGLAPQDKGFAESIGDMLATNLAESKGIQILERSQIKSAFSALKLDISVAVDQETAVKVGSWLGATHVVVGTLAALGDRVRLDSRVVSLKAGVVEKSARAEGTRKEMFDLVNTLSSRVLASLTGEAIKFTEGPKTLLDKSFTLNASPTSKTKRLVSAAVFEGNDPPLVVTYATDYRPQSLGAVLGGGKGKGLGGWLEKLDQASGTAGFSNPQAIQLLINDTPIVTWSADDGRNNLETRQSMEIGGTPVNVTIQTQRVVAGPSRAQNGQPGPNQLSSVVVKVMIERQTP